MPSAHQRLELRVSLDAVSIQQFLDLLVEAITRASDQQSRDNAMWPASRPALFAGQKPPEDKGLLINTREVAKLLKVSARTVFQMQKDGVMPRQIQFGKTVRWSYEELRAWAAAGCPPRDRWNWPQQNRQAN